MQCCAVLCCAVQCCGCAVLGEIGSQVDMRRLSVPSGAHTVGPKSAAVGEFTRAAHEEGGCNHETHNTLQQQQRSRPTDRRAFGGSALRSTEESAGATLRNGRSCSSCGRTQRCVQRVSGARRTASTTRECQLASKEQRNIVLCSEQRPLRRGAPWPSQRGR